MKSVSPYFFRHPVGQVERHEHVGNQLQADGGAVLDQVIVEGPVVLIFADLDMVPGHHGGQGPRTAAGSTGFPRC